MLPNADPVHKISIVARGMTLGHTRQLPIEDRYLMSRGQLQDMIATLLGGHTAEKLVFNEVTTGGYDDIKRATEYARRMVTDFGMSDKLGPRTFGDKQEMVFLGREISEQKDYGDKLADAIDAEVNRIIQQAQETAREILTKNRSRLELIAQRLIAEETLEGEELEALFKEPAPKKAIASIPSRAEKAPPKAKAKPATRKTRISPQIIPKQAPASP
jgi:cell division protease FtsH